MHFVQLVRYNPKQSRGKMNFLKFSVTDGYTPEFAMLAESRFSQDSWLTTRVTWDPRMVFQGLYSQARPLGLGRSISAAS